MALAYSLVFTFLLYRLGGDPFGIQDKVAWLLEQLPALAGVAQAVTDFVSKYLLFITNALVVLVFLAVKAICLPIVGALWRSRPGADAGHLRLVLRVRRGVSALVFTGALEGFPGAHEGLLAGGHPGGRGADGPCPSSSPTGGPSRPCPIPVSPP